MSFGVIVNERTAPPSKGAPTDTGKLHIVGEVSAGPTNSATEIHSIADLEAAYADRTDAAMVPLYDYLDAYFREGGNTAVVGGYPADGDFGDGLALLDDWRKGPGQLAVVGTAAGETLFSDMDTLCANTNRVGLLDVGQTDTVADMETAAGLMPENNDRMAMFGSWVNIPGPSNVIGAGPRQVPASAVIAALCNRVDRAGNPNRAAAGRDYPLQYVDSIVLDPGDTDRAGLFLAGVNALMDDFGVLENYGFQTNIAPTTQTPFWQFNCSRARMWLKANARAVASPYMFRNIDAEGTLVGALCTDLAVLCKQLYDANGLFGVTPQAAYSITPTVDISDTGLGVIHVVLEAIYSLHTRSVEIDLVSVPVSGVITTA